MELINGFLKVFGGVSFLGILGGALIYLSRLMAQQVFKKNMADYQVFITEELEKLKLENQKNFKDFELFISKKHEKYPEMYLLLETAYGEIFGLRGIRDALTFENVNEEDLNFYFDELGMTHFDRERIIGLWRADNKPFAIDLIQEIERTINYRRAKEKWREANNYYYYNLLYLSDSVSEKCKVYITNLHEYLTYLDPKFIFTTPEMLKERTNLTDNILPENRESVKTEMQNELRIE